MIRKAWWRSALTAAAAAGLVSLAPTANADPDPISVAAYLHTLNVLHVPYDNPGRMVDIGNNVCQQARGGTDFDTIYPTVAGNGFASAQAGQVMGAAVGTFCPTWRPRSTAGPTARGLRGSTTFDARQGT